MYWLLMFMAHGSCLKARGSRPRLALDAPSPRPRRQIFFALSHEPWGMSHGPWAISHEPLTMNYSSIQYKYIMYFKISEVSKVQHSKIPECLVCLPMHVLMKILIPCSMFFKYCCRKIFSHKLHEYIQYFLTHLNRRRWFSIYFSTFFLFCRCFFFF